ncbi:MAG: Bax inhibitor-1 family protein, partial [Candidatus Magasanikbacteria bacterium]|nr:Bax inhibitor-1 family protein [Candidatus Magasanikbacteria bacterium]
MGFGISDSVWKREKRGGVDTLSTTTYLAAVTGFTVYGMLLAAVIAFYTLSWHPESMWTYLGIGLVVPIIGIFISLGSKDWLVSLFGYTLVVVGLGAITGPTVAMYQTGVVMSALMATAGVTIVMSLVGILYQKSLEGWGGYLFGALLALVFVRVAQSIMIGMGVKEEIWYMPWIEYAAAVLFSLYIVYDWNRALRLP